MIDNRDYIQLGIFVNKKGGLDEVGTKAIRKYIYLVWKDIPPDSRNIKTLSEALDEPRNRVRRLLLSIPKLAKALGYRIVRGGRFLRKV